MPTTIEKSEKNKTNGQFVPGSAKPKRKNTIMKYKAINYHKIQRAIFHKSLSANNR